MFESLKGFCTVLVTGPPRIQVKWDRIAHRNLTELEIVWWCIGNLDTEGFSQFQHASQFLIDVEPGRAYVIAARTHYKHYRAADSHDPGDIEYYVSSSPSPWAYEIVEVPPVEDKPQHTDLGQVTVIDTPRGPAILLDELWEARG